MLTQICAEIKNYFSLNEDRFIGDFEIVDGNIMPPVPIQENQYYRIVGSVFNDGVHEYDDLLTDETKFHGAIWLMRVPQDVIDLATEVEEWQGKYGDVNSQVMSPYQSESFGGYSYSKISGTSGSGGVSGYSWKDAFASRLNVYRKVCEL